MNFVWSTGEKWRTLRTNPIALRELVWQHDNARPHVKQAVQSFFAARHIELLPQPAYSPDLNLCDRWLNDRIKTELRQQHFDNHCDVEKAIVDVLRSIPVEQYRHELEKLIRHCSQIIDVGGGYVTPH